MIVVVAGIPCSGKSEFIARNFPEYRKLDWYDYQPGSRKLEITGDINERYDRFMSDIADAAKNGENVVIENTLYKKRRRAELIEAVGNVSDAPVYLYVMEPSKERYAENYRRRFHEHANNALYRYAQENEDIEPYTADEGFDGLYRVRDGEGEFDWTVVSDAISEV